MFIRHKTKGYTAIFDVDEIIKVGVDTYDDEPCVRLQLERSASHLFLPVETTEQAVALYERITSQLRHRRPSAAEQIVELP